MGSTDGGGLDGVDALHPKFWGGQSPHLEQRIVIFRWKDLAVQPGTGAGHKLWRGWSCGCGNVVGWRKEVVMMMVQQGTARLALSVLSSPLVVHLSGSRPNGSIGGDTKKGCVFCSTSLDALPVAYQSNAQHTPVKVHAT